MLLFFFCVEALPNSFFLGIPQKNRNIVTKPIHAGLGGVILLRVMKHCKVLPLLRELSSRQKIFWAGPNIVRLWIIEYPQCGYFKSSGRKKPRRLGRGEWEVGFISLYKLNRIPL